MFQEIFGKIVGSLCSDSIPWFRVNLPTFPQRNNSYATSMCDFVLSEYDSRQFCTEHWFDITPLMVACYGCNMEAVKLLLDKGSDVNQADSLGLTALSYALFTSREEIVKLLLEKGAKVNVAVHASMGLQNEAKKKDCERYEVKTLDELLKMANRLTVTGLTPLFFAVAQSTPAMVELLIKYGANVNARNVYGETPLEYALRDRVELDAGAMLIAGGATFDIAELDRKLNDSFKRFDNNYRSRLLEFLLRSGSKDDRNINLLYSRCIQYVDTFYSSIYELAAAQGCRELIRMLLSKNEAGTVPTNLRHKPLVWSSRYPEITTLLLDAGFGDALTEDQWMEILKRAFSKTSIAPQEALRGVATKINSYCKLAPEKWLSLWSSGGHDFASTTVLIDLCSDINVCDAQENTILIKLAASSTPDPMLAKLMIDKGIKINAQNGEGNTALIQAVKFFREPLVSFLLDAKADAAIRNHAGKTALQIALEKKQNAIAEILQKYNH